MNTLEQFDLTGRVALVTGASSGIGRALADSLAGAGAQVVLLARRTAELQRAADELSAAGHHATFVAADLSSLRGIPAIAKHAQAAFGAVDILINAAGINLREPAEDITPESWEATLTLNLSAPFFLARELVPAMRAKGWGKIINIASLQTQRAFANGIAYGASKGGVGQLTRAMAEAWSAHGIGCNAIAPGFFPTDLTAQVFDDPQRAAQLAAQTAIGRNGVLQDLSGAAVFLSAPASDYITGQILYVDGGFTAK